MNLPINIIKVGARVSLVKGKHSIYILGGWGIKLGKFSISIKNIKSGLVTKCVSHFWRVQSFINGKRAKQIFKVEVPESGEYEVLFHFTETIVVKHSNLFITSRFQEPISSKEIYVLF